MRITNIAFAGIALLACRQPDEQRQVRSHDVATSNIVPLPPQRPPPQVGDTASNRVTITGPTVVVAFPRISPADSSSEDVSTTYDDWSHYAGKALRFLKAREVHTVFLMTDSVRVSQDGREFILPVSNEPLVFLATPRRTGRELRGGIGSDADIIDLAANYFWNGRVPNAVGDTLTAETARADFAITRPTIIAFFPRPDPDSARIAERVEHLRDSLDRRGVTILLTFKHRFTVFERGRVDTIQASGYRGFYVTAPDAWSGELWIGPRSDEELVHEIQEYLTELRSKTRREN